MIFLGVVKKPRPKLAALCGANGSLLRLSGNLVRDFGSLKLLHF